VIARKPAIGFIIVTVALDVLGFGLLIPVAPRLVEELSGKDEAGAAPLVGALGAIFAIMQFIFAPILGSLSDRFGRRPVILISLFGSAIDYFAMAMAPTLAILFITRAINGITGANFSACNAYVADVTPPEKRAAAFGMLGAAFGLGFIIGPLAGGLLSTIDLRAPFWVAGGLTLINWMYGCFVLPESLPLDRRRAFSLATSNPFATFVHVTKYPVIAWLGASMFVMNIAMFMLHATWVLYTQHRYQWSPTITGGSLAMVGLGAAIVQGGLARKIIPKLGEPCSLLTGAVIGILAYIGYGLSTDGWMIYVIIAVASLGGIAQPALQAIITKATPPTEQGQIQGGLQGLGSVAAMIGHPLGGAVFGYFISKSAPAYVPGASYFLSALLATVGLLLAVVALGKKPRNEAQATQA
jgi:DHA1 family tetracycline resistance protein-like MFS transporter